MAAETARIVDAWPRVSFDVILAGELVWRGVSLRGGALAPSVPSAAILDVARMLARRAFRLGLATVLDDDTFGRKLLAELAALGVDVRGARLAPAAAGLVTVDAAGGQLGVIAERSVSRDFEIPPGWSSGVLLLSGLSPVTSKAAALCKAARRARREGSLVVLDAAGSLRQWAGCDPRMISMVLREADVVHCSVLDLAVLGIDTATVRHAMRPQATLVVGDGSATTATGPFGEVRVEGPSSAEESGEERTASICAEFARPRRGVESRGGRWARVLRRSKPSR